MSGAWFGARRGRGETTPGEADCTLIVGLAVTGVINAVGRANRASAMVPTSLGDAFCVGRSCEYPMSGNNNLVH